MRGKPFGFTLIELMIVVAIMGIIAAMALPSYQSHIRRSHRAEGLAALQKIQLLQEQYRVNHATYGTLAATWGATTSTERGYYTMSVTNNTATNYTITATAAGDQANDVSEGTDCSSIVLTVSAAAETKTPFVCWK